LSAPLKRKIDEDDDPSWSEKKGNKNKKGLAKKACEVDYSSPFRKPLAQQSEQRLSLGNVEQTNGETGSSFHVL